MFGPTDPVALGQLVVEAGKWVAEVINRRKNKKEQMAAHILKEAGVLVAALRALDNSTQKVLAPFLRLEADWSKEQRSRLFDGLDKYVREKVIVSTIRLSLATLGDYYSHSEDIDKSLRESIWSHMFMMLRRAKAILAAAEGEQPEMDFFSEWELAEFWRALKHAENEDEIAKVARWTAETLRKLDRRLPADAEEKFGKLKSAILRKYPSLPDPLWTNIAFHGKAKEAGAC